MIIYKGTFKLLTLDDAFIRYLTLQNIEEFYDVIERLPARYKNWNIQYFVNGKIHEIISVNASYGIVRKKMKDMKRMNYKQGLLVAVAAK